MENCTQVNLMRALLLVVAAAWRGATPRTPSLGEEGDEVSSVTADQGTEVGRFGFRRSSSRGVQNTSREDSAARRDSVPAVVQEEEESTGLEAKAQVADPESKVANGAAADEAEPGCHEVEVDPGIIQSEAASLHLPLQALPVNATVQHGEEAVDDAMEEGSDLAAAPEVAGSQPLLETGVHRGSTAGGSGEGDVATRDLDQGEVPPGDELRSGEDDANSDVDQGELPLGDDEGKGEELSGTSQQMEAASASPEHSLRVSDADAVTAPSSDFEERQRESSAGASEPGVTDEVSRQPDDGSNGPSSSGLALPGRDSAEMATDVEDAGRLTLRYESGVSSYVDDDSEDGEEADGEDALSPLTEGGVVHGRRGSKSPLEESSSLLRFPPRTLADLEEQQAGSARSDKRWKLLERVASGRAVARPERAMHWESSISWAAPTLAVESAGDAHAGSASPNPLPRLGPAVVMRRKLEPARVGKRRATGEEPPNSPAPASPLSLDFSMGGDISDEVERQRLAVAFWLQVLPSARLSPSMIPRNDEQKGNNGMLEPLSLLYPLTPNPPAPAAALLLLLLLQSVCTHINGALLACESVQPITAKLTPAVKVSTSAALGGLCPSRSEHGCYFPARCCAAQSPPFMGNASLLKIIQNDRNLLRWAHDAERLCRKVHDSRLPFCSLPSSSRWRQHCAFGKPCPTPFYLLTSALPADLV